MDCRFRSSLGIRLRDPEVLRYGPEVLRYASLEGISSVLELDASGRAIHNMGKYWNQNCREILIHLLLSNGVTPNRSEAKELVFELEKKYEIRDRNCIDDEECYHCRKIAKSIKNKNSIQEIKEIKKYHMIRKQVWI